MVIDIPGCLPVRSKVLALVHSRVEECGGMFTYSCSRDARWKSRPLLSY